MKNLFFSSLLYFTLNLAFASDVEEFKPSKEPILTSEKNVRVDLESEQPKILAPLPTVVRSLVVGSGLLGSQRHFFGGNSFVGMRSSFVDPNGYILEDPTKENLERYKIPELELNNVNELLYRFPDGFTTNSREEAISHQNRKADSPMDTDPATTVYMDILNLASHHSPFGKDFNHLQGDILKIKSLPNNIKVDKIVIEYLGDDLYRGKDLTLFDWSWLGNLHNMLSREGRIYFEMRADKCMRQEKPKKPELTTELANVVQNIKRMGDFDYFGRPGIESMLQMGEFTTRKETLTPEEIKDVLDHLFEPEPSRPDHEKILEVLKENFVSFGFNSEGIFCPASHDLSSRLGRSSHIPNRFYHTVRIEAWPANNNKKRHASEEKEDKHKMRQAPQNDG